jgi:hypothetical protein
MTRAKHRAGRAGGCLTNANGAVMRTWFLSLCVLLTSCGGDSGGPFVGIATPTPTPAPGVVVLTHATLGFTATGAAFAQTSTASQSNYSGTFTASTTTCAGIATISASSGTTFTVTPLAPGSCSFTIAGGNGQSTTLAVGVTTTSVGGN